MESSIFEELACAGLTGGGRGSAGTGLPRFGCEGLGDLDSRGVPEREKKGCGDLNAYSSVGGGQKQKPHWQK